MIFYDSFEFVINVFVIEVEISSSIATLSYMFHVTIIGYALVVAFASQKL